VSRRRRVDRRHRGSRATPRAVGRVRPFLTEVDYDRAWERLAGLVCNDPTCAGEHGDWGHEPNSGAL
jgi:hypothetical protein